MVSLRLGHAAALTCHRHVIHYRSAASLPLALPRDSVVDDLSIVFDSLRAIDKCRRIYYPAVEKDGNEI